MRSQRYSIIVDTNMLGYYKKDKLVCTNFKYLAISKDLFLGLIKFLSDNDLTKNISVVIPKVVLEELKRQQEREYVAQLDKLKKTFSTFAELPGFKLETTELDYGGQLEQKGKGFISKYGIIELEYPENGILPKLITRVLNREKPFYKRESGKDAGFKDALIWESILAYARDHKEEKIIFLTRDPDFNNTKLIEEVEEIGVGELRVVNNFSDMKAFLDETQKLNLDFTRIRDVFEKNIRRTLYGVLGEQFSGILTGGLLFRIRDFAIGKKLVDINRIDNDVYELRVMVRVRHETPYTGYGVVDDLYEAYEEGVETGVAVLRIEKKESGELFLTGIKFEGVDLFGNTNIEQVVVS